MIAQHQKLPSGSTREALRNKGQFWTPEWVAEAMVTYAIGGGVPHIFDPAVGAGAFFRAAKKVASEMNRQISLLGTELDPSVLHQALASGLSEADMHNVMISDFLLAPPDRSFGAIVANPPYIRHHRLSPHLKANLKHLGESIIGTALDGRAGLHIYFLLRALQLLEYNGRLAFIMPADTCEGVFAPTLWNWITLNYQLEAVITFTQEAAPFPNVDTNAIVFLIKNRPPQECFLWVQCREAHTTQLKEWMHSGFQDNPGDALVVQQRHVSEALSTGLSRPFLEKPSSYHVLGDFATVLRGVATGANEFFFLTRNQADAIGIPDNFLLRAIGRTRDVIGDEITSNMIQALDDKGRPTFLFSPDGRPLEYFPDAVRKYLKLGEEMGLHSRTLIATRRPWYKMETRPVPPFLFAYLGRRNARFLRNHVGVTPLTSFLCVYPRLNDPSFINNLWQVLKHPEIADNLRLVGKSYGAGAIKVEPRALEKLPLPASLMEDAGLIPPVVATQLRLFERNSNYNATLQTADKIQFS